VCFCIVCGSGRVTRKLAQSGDERYSTRKSYQSLIKKHIKPHWSDVPIASMKTMAIEDWLKRLKLAPETKEEYPQLDAHSFSMCDEVGTGEQEPNRPCASEGRLETSDTELSCYWE